MSPTRSTRKTLRVHGDQVPMEAPHAPLILDSAEWYAWLAAESTRAFIYEAAAGTLSARRERQRNGQYWYAYRRSGGRLRKIYLGRAADLNRARLDAALATLTRAAPPPAALPDATATPDTLLWTRLIAPPVRSGALARPQLLAQLASSTPLTLICAPAGFGKTTIVVRWLASSPAASGWVALTARDDDPAQFWQTVFAALERAYPGLWRDAQLYIRQQLPSATIAAELLARGCAAYAAPVRLVLDDYHLITHTAIHDAFGQLLDQPPAHFQLVLITRSDPPLPLARWRARGQMTELRADDLRFTPDETTRFVRDTMQLDLAAPAVAVLATRTEGWAAGLQLAALALRTITLRTSHAQRTSAIAQWVQAFRGNHRSIAEYLVGEVLDEQTADVQDFLLHTAVLDQLSAESCAALTELSVTAAQAMLDQIERANLFLIPLDEERRWYRYHQLFAEMLRQRLQQQAPALADELHRRAASWYRAHNRWQQAIEHGFAAQDFARVADDIEIGGELVIWQQGDIQMITRWIAQLPDAITTRRPALLLNAAWASLATVQRAPTERLLSEVLHALDTGACADDPARQAALRGEVLGLRAFLVRIDGDTATALTLSTQALEQIPTQRTLARSLLINNMHNACVMTGDVEQLAALYAQQRSSAPDQVGIKPMNQISMHHSLLVERGQLTEAEAHMQRLLTRSAHPTGDGTMPIWFRYGGIQIALATSAYERNQLDTAESYAEQATALGRNWWNNDIVLQGSFVLHDIAWARGQHLRAQQLEAELLDLAQAYQFAYIRWQFRAVHAAFALRRGDLAAARSWEQECGLRAAEALDPVKFYEYGTLARVLLATERADQALLLATRLCDLALAGASIPRQLTGLLLCAEVCARHARQPAALAHLTNALLIGRPGGYVRTFLDHGAPIRQLLMQSASQNDAAGAYAQRLLREEARAHHSTPDAALLSPREIEIMHLLALGKTARTIATELTIAVSTVQSHIKHIYTKLAATSRVHALRSARERGLLGDR